METIPINYLAVLAAAVANMALGALWFGPIFGKAWVKASGMSDEKVAQAKSKSMAGNYALMFIGSLVMAYVLAHALVFGNTYLGTAGISAGLTVGFWNWLGFVAPVTIGVVLWDGKPWKFWAITYLYNLVGLLIMGAILAVW